MGLATSNKNIYSEVLSPTVGKFLLTIKTHIHNTSQESLSRK